MTSVSRANVFLSLKCFLKYHFSIGSWEICRIANVLNKPYLIELNLEQVKIDPTQLKPQFDSRNNFI